MEDQVTKVYEKPGRLYKIVAINVGDPTRVQLSDEKGLTTVEHIRNVKQIEIGTDSIWGSDVSDSEGQT